MRTEHVEAEKGVFQCLNREASRRFLTARRSNAQGKQPMPQGGGGLAPKQVIPYPTAGMRELLLATMSTKLRLFHEVCKSIGKVTFVDGLQRVRDQGLDGFRLVRFLCTRLSLSLPRTAT